MILTGNEIKKRLGSQIVIEPFKEANLGPNSYDITLHPHMKKYFGSDYLDPKRENKTYDIIIPDTGLILQPRTVYLARTNEYTETRGLVPMLEGRSSIGRLGMFIHVTAGFGDIGFKGTWTLEIVVVEPVKVYPDMRIGQLFYHTVEGDITEYNGRYQGQFEPTGSRYNK